MTAETSDLLIISTRGPDDAPVCELAWRGEFWYAPVAEVRATALDLFTCAAYAEMIRHLMATLNLDAPTATALTSDMLGQLRSEEFGTPATVTLMPAVSKPAGPAKRRKALVLIRRDRARRAPWEGEVDAVGGAENGGPVP